MSLVQALSFLSAILMGFTVVDAGCYLVTGSSLAENCFGGGSPVSEAIFEMVPGMTAWEFFAANAIVLCCVTALLFASVYGTMRHGDFEDDDCPCAIRPCDGDGR